MDPTHKQIYALLKTDIALKMCQSFAIIRDNRYVSIKTIMTKQINISRDKNNLLQIKQSESFRSTEVGTVDMLHIK